MIFVCAHEFGVFGIFFLQYSRLVLRTTIIAC